LPAKGLRLSLLLDGEPAIGEEVHEAPRTYTEVIAGLPGAVPRVQILKDQLPCASLCAGDRPPKSGKM
jgi:hypothetical protein